MHQARVSLIGAGYIAAWHLDALRATPGTRVAAVVDPDLRAAERLAARARGALAFASLGDALAAGDIDRAHVLVPPQLHGPVTEEALAAGLPTFVEKPLGVSIDEASTLSRIALDRGVALGVNQNFMFEPLLERFAADLQRGRYGRLRHVNALYAVPLRQLAARQFSHWMFERPSNIVLEQMVHPLSQLLRLLGRLQVTAAASAAAEELAPGIRFHRSFDVSLRAHSGTAQLHLAFARGLPTRQLHCLCDNALVVLDLGRGTMARLQPTRYLDQADAALAGSTAALGQLWQSAWGLARNAAGQLGIAQRSDAFLRSMVASVRAFHGAVDAGRTPPVDGAAGAHLVELCDQVVRAAGVSTVAAARPRSIGRNARKGPSVDVAVLGGTGFIGRAVVGQLLREGATVGVLARGMRGLASEFHEPGVALVEGDIRSRADIERGLGTARRVIHLAPGAGVGSRQAIISGMVDAARAVGEACLERGVDRLVHVSSIAALYLGDPRETVTPATAVDRHGRQRADYSVAKAQAERQLLSMHREHGLPVVVQRPGVVVGTGASPFHSGLGLFNNEQHCLGWSSGRNPLPFVLVQDCAAAILLGLAAVSDVHGRTDNIVGGVRLSAREYIDELAAALGSPVRFHPGSPRRTQLVEAIKWGIKRGGGGNPPFPYVRDFRSRGLYASFDTSETERVLGWKPELDRATFVQLAVVEPASTLRGP